MLHKDPEAARAWRRNWWAERVTERDRQDVRDAMVAGFNECKQTNYFGMNARQKCDCDMGAIDGCKARVEVLAKVLATARTHAPVAGVKQP